MIGKVIHDTEQIANTLSVVVGDLFFFFLRGEPEEQTKKIQRAPYH